jgi:hypothetical protein
VSAHEDWLPAIIKNYLGTLLNVFPFWMDREETLKLDSLLAASPDFKEVYREPGYAVYENLAFRGTVFALSSAAGETPLFYESTDAAVPLEAGLSGKNTAVTNLSNDGPIRVFFSRNYTAGWQASLMTQRADGTATRTRLDVLRSDSIICVDVTGPGEHQLVLHYQYYDSSLIMFGAWYVPFAAIAILIVLYTLRKKNPGQNSRLFLFTSYGLAALGGGVLITYALWPQVALAAPGAGIFSGLFHDKYLPPVFLLGLALAAFGVVSVVITTFTRKYYIRQWIRAVYPVLMLVIIGGAYLGIGRSGPAAPDFARLALAAFAAAVFLYISERVYDALGRRQARGGEKERG